jgi:hypothetical protein
MQELVDYSEGKIDLKTSDYNTLDTFDVEAVASCILTRHIKAVEELAK